MACVITFNGGRFTAKTGEEFTVGVKAPPGGGFGFLHIIYAGSDPVKAAPYTFKVESGVQSLHVFYAPDSANQQGETFTLVEVCEATNQTLAINKFHFSDPHFGIDVEGV